VVGAPAWSPDGTTIAFAAKTADGFDIFTTDASGGRPRQLTHSGTAQAPAWSPDGAQIAYADGTDGLDISVVNLDGTSGTRITRWKADETTPRFNPRRSTQAG
jgi:TolB protein